jgi:carbon monoxide dehydrogenase subunit G
LKIQGQHRIEAPRDEVWQALLDPEVLAATVPGSQGLEQTGENAYAGKLKIKVGPVQGVFEGKVVLSDLEPSAGYNMKIEGRGPAGFVNGNGSVQLSDDEGGTLLGYDVDAQVGGRIAGVGQRLLESSSKVITRQALESLSGQIEARHAVAAEDPSEGAVPKVEKAAPPPSPTHGEVVTDFAKELVKETVPRPYRRLASLIAAGVVAVMMVFLVRSCA